MDLGDEICQCFINCSKHTTLVRDIDHRRGYKYVEAGITWEISMPSQFSHDLNVPLSSSLNF